MIESIKNSLRATLTDPRLPKSFAQIFGDAFINILARKILAEILSDQAKSLKGEEKK